MGVLYHGRQGFTSKWENSDLSRACARLKGDRGRLSSKCNSERRDLFHGSLDNGALGQANEANEPTGMLRMVGQPTKAMPAQPIVKGLSRHKPLRLNLNQGR